MSRGPGSIETRIGDLFAVNRDRALSVDELADRAFALERNLPTRAQRLSAIRAAHRVIRRIREMDEKRGRLRAEAGRRVRTALGRETHTSSDKYAEYYKLLKADPQWQEADRLWKMVSRIGVKSRWRREGRDTYVWVDTDYWRASALGKGRGAGLWFHAPDVPVQVWAVRIDRSGVHWFDAELVRITTRNVMVRYAGPSPGLIGTRYGDRGPGGAASCSFRAKPGGSLPGSRSCGGNAMERRSACRPCRCRSQTRSRCRPTILARMSSPRFSGRRGLVQIWADAKGTTIVYRRGGRSSNRLGYTRRLVHG